MPFGFLLHFFIFRNRFAIVRRVSSSGKSTAGRNGVKCISIPKSSKLGTGDAITPADNTHKPSSGVL